MSRGRSKFTQDLQKCNVKHGVAAPSQERAQDLPMHPILRLQRLLGNRATSNMIQAKLTVAPAGDQSEQEADAMARYVERRLSISTDLTVANAQNEEKSHGCECSNHSVEQGLIVRKPLPSPNMQRRSEDVMGGQSVSADVEAKVQRSLGGGAVIADTIRGKLENAFDADFSSVRLHTDSKADALNRLVNARAFTVGRDIFFRQAEYDPNKSSGLNLLAHELSHVVQQGAASTGWKKQTQGVPSQLQRAVCQETSHQTNPQHRAIQQYFKAQTCQHAKSEYGVPPANWNHSNQSASGYIDIADDDHNQIYEIKPATNTTGNEQLAIYKARVKQCGAPWLQNVALGNRFPTTHQTISYGPGLGSLLVAYRTSPGIIKYHDASEAKKRKVEAVIDGLGDMHDEIVAFIKKSKPSLKTSEIEAALQVLMEGGTSNLADIVAAADAIKSLAGDLAALVANRIAKSEVFEEGDTSQKLVEVIRQLLIERLGGTSAAVQSTR